jgi:radical SAM family uncharacterized protein
LFTLENKYPVGECDIVGFSLQYELCYCNVLAMLDLAGIPLRAQQRARHPLIIAGGPCCYNPEPMADFIDVFFIGESEELVVEFIEEYRQFKNKVRLIGENDRTVFVREKNYLLKRLAAIEGLYVPQLYKTRGQEQGLLVPYPAADAIPATVNRRFISNLDGAPFPTSPVVPCIETVHDRISLEIMRGCPNRCFFCQAGYTMNPVRIRKVETLLSLAEKSYRNTGYDTIAFCALSSSNYPFLKELIIQMHALCVDKGMSISLPSLRIDKELLGIISMISDLKKSGLTFAPEAGSRRLRMVINKDIDIDQLEEVVSEAYRGGWKRLKLYFMIGLPSERDEDLESIVELIESCSALRKPVDGKWGNISVGISNFIPRPHTPFQSFGMETRDNLLRKQEFLRKRLWRKNFEVDFHNVQMSFLEACLARGDRRLGAVIESAFRNGARFDAWANMLNAAAWQQAFGEQGIEATRYAHAGYESQQPLPWGHINCGNDPRSFSAIAAGVFAEQSTPVTD